MFNALALQFAQLYGDDRSICRPYVSRFCRFLLSLPAPTAPIFRQKSPSITVMKLVRLNTVYGVLWLLTLAQYIVDYDET